MSTVYAEDPSNAPLAEPLLTAADAAKLLAVRPGWVYAAVRAGNLPHVRLGRQVRFLRTDLEAFVAYHRANRRAAR
jgi:excisionase family DNA binding protein